MQVHCEPLSQLQGGGWLHRCTLLTMTPRLVKKLYILLPPAATGISDLFANFEPSALRAAGSTFAAGKWPALFPREGLLRA